jgi:hypothetical protein
LPNNSEQFADVVNRAGLWVKEAEPKIADRYYGIIQRRCPRAKIGHAAIHYGWFVDQSGRWSEAKQQSREALRKELNIKDSSQ